jgi:hypothetical protein
MRIGLVTNWGTHCAVAEYAKALADNCLRHTKEVEFKIVTGDLNYEGVSEHVQDVDIIHFNYCGHAFLQMKADCWPLFRNYKPVIMTFHESADWKVRTLASGAIADLIVVHDKMRDGMPPPKNVRTIPFGVPEIDLTGIQVEANKVGTFGCAFPWKQTVPLAYVCGQLKIPFMAVLSEPDSDPNVRWEQLLADIKDVCPQAEILTGWRPEEEVVRLLASCSLVALPFDPAAPINGISASARYALASKRPTLVTKMAHFADLIDYQDEIYVTDGDLKNAVLTVLQHTTETRPSRTGVRKPNRILKDMSWKRSAEMYCDLYKTLVTSKEEVYAR